MVLAFYQKFWKVYYKIFVKFNTTKQLFSILDFIMVTIIIIAKIVITIIAAIMVINLMWTIVIIAIIAIIAFNNLNIFSGFIIYNALKF